MDPPAAPPRRRAIPRPWLEKQQQQKQRREQQEQQYTTPLKQTQPQIIISPMSFEMASEQQPMILLEKPNPLKSFLKMDWCCRDQTKVDQQQRPTFGVPVQQIYHNSNATAPVWMQQQQQPVWNYQQPPESPHDESCSSFLLAPRPTVIYVIQGNPSTIDGGGGGGNWHQSYLSIAEDTPPQRPRVVQQRNTSFDTSMTSLSVDDSLAFSDDLPPQRRYTEDDTCLFQQQRRRSSSNSISRPPRLLSKSQTTGNTRPPMAPVSKRPSLLQHRSSTTGSTTSSTNSRHRRSFRKLDRDILQRMQSDDTGDDDDDGHSPIFPFLINKSSSPRSQDSERKEEELYMPKCASLEQESSDILLSGWVAYSMGDSSLHKRKMGSKHLAYLVIYESDPTAIHLLQTPAGGGGEGTGEGDPVSSTSLKLPKSNPGNNNNHRTTLSVQAVESPGGRSVVIQQASSSSNNPKILLTLLPVNLPEGQFDATSGTVKNRRIHNNTNNMSVAQHDAALYLWFGLDGWMRRRC